MSYKENWWCHTMSWMSFDFTLPYLMSHSDAIRSEWCTDCHKQIQTSPKSAWMEGKLIFTSSMTIFNLRSNQITFKIYWFKTVAIRNKFLEQISKSLQTGFGWLGSTLVQRKRPACLPLKYTQFPWINRSMDLSWTIYSILLTNRSSSMQHSLDFIIRCSLRIT